MTVRRPIVLVSGRLRELPSGDSLPVTYNGGADPIIASFDGTLTTRVGSYRYYHPTTTSIVSAYISVGTTSSSGSVTVDVNLNGTSILGAPMSLAAGSYVSTPVTLNQAITPSDYLTIDIDGAGTDAKDLNVYLIVSAIGSAISPPASATSSGTVGQIAYDSSYLYVCVATNTWKRAAVSTW